MRFITVLLLLSSSCFAQLDLSYSKRKTLIGVTAPQIVGDEIIVGDDSGTPTLVNGAVIKAKSIYTFIELEVTLNGEEIDLSDPVETKEEVDGKTEVTSKWVVKGEGKYKVTARAVDVNLGFKKSKIEFIIGALPRPVDPVDDPVLPPVPDNLSSTAKDVRAVAVAYLHGMGDDYARLSQGKFKSVLEASAEANKLDLATRKTFKEGMGKIMMPLIGSDQLPLNYPSIFMDISNGFKGIK